MNIRIMAGMVLIGVALAAVPVKASNDSISFKVHVSGHVKTQCTLQTSGVYQQLSEDIFRIDTKNILRELLINSACLQSTLGLHMSRNMDFERYAII